MSFVEFKSRMESFGTSAGTDTDTTFAASEFGDPLVPDEQPATTSTDTTATTPHPNIGFTSITLGSPQPPHHDAASTC
ncbi:hypothetical protein [Williamsia sp. CHRR-6]|uniref:hypothetical protein n=1 Tax=Williamsia sp. CHRR-6 TaxID=2835871 RepID=UPI001BDA9FB4|nr:hypothetical protein [Williamsia sp. CHRR-6]MBT0567668.1 hypothetical protein [Williamsia sp. CHRR-6]